MKKIEAVILPGKLDDVIASVVSVGVSGLTMIEVRTRGSSEPRLRYRGSAPVTMGLAPHVKIEIVVPDFKADQVVEAIRHAARVGQRDEGRILILPLADALRIRTGESGEDAL
jgi:nitrogen regulatory protein PII